MDEKNRITESDLIYQMNKNVVQQGSFLGIPYRRWIEAIVFASIGAGIICIINFTALVKGIAGTMAFVSLFGIFLRGIMNRSITEVLIDEIKFQKNKRVLHLRGPEYVRKKREFRSIGGNQSHAAELWEKGKSILIGWAKDHRNK